MKDTASSYFDKYKERYEKEYKAFQEGKYTEAQFKAWVSTQLARGEGYEKMADKLASRMVKADEVASAYINDTTPSIYSLNHNYEAYRISQAEKVDFQLTDEQTVKELMQGKNHTEFKTTSINPKRDYEWNSKKIHNALNSAILQGKSIDKLADSFYSVMKADRASAIRNARTSFTSAQNAGRMASYEQAKELGIQMEKEWIATHDERTRDSHGELDGTRIPYDEAFSNGLLYPADPDGEPCEVYNCRCTMRAVIPNINDAHRETYSEWLERMKPEETQEEAERDKIVFTRVNNLEEAKEYARENLGIYLEDFERVNIEVVNTILEQTTDIYNVFGNLSESGQLKGFRLYPKKVTWAGAYSPAFNEVFVKNVTAKNSLTKMINDAKLQTEVGWWSKSLPEKQVFSHELGHAVQHKFLDAVAGNPYGNSVEKEKEIEELRESILNKCGIMKWSNSDSFENIKKAGDHLSYYGLRNTGEFVAESIAEYMGGNPRETAKKVVEILLRK